MDIASILFWAAVVGLVIYVVSIYNHLVRIKHSVSKAWSNIDVLLKQRHDEIPKLVETCKQYMKFEQETLEKVALPGEKPASQPAIHHLGDPGGRPGDAEKAKSLLGSYGRFSGFQYTSSDVFNSCLFIRLIDRRS